MREVKRWLISMSKYYIAIVHLISALITISAISIIFVIDISFAKLISSIL